MPQVASDTNTPPIPPSRAPVQPTRSSRPAPTTSFESLLDDSAPSDAPPEPSAPAKTASTDAAPKPQAQGKSEKPANTADSQPTSASKPGGKDDQQTDAAKTADQTKVGTVAKAIKKAAEQTAAGDAGKSDNVGKDGKPDGNDAGSTDAAQTKTATTAVAAITAAPAAVPAVAGAVAPVAVVVTAATPQTPVATPKSDAVAADGVKKDVPSIKLTALKVDTDPATNAEQSGTGPAAPAAPDAKNTEPALAHAVDKKTDAPVHAEFAAKVASTNAATPPADPSAGGGNSAQALTLAASTQPSAPAPATAANSGTPAPPPAAAVPIAGLAVEIAGRALAGKNRFEIRLDPPELGRIEVRLDVNRDGSVTTHIAADRSDTLGLLQRDASGLQRALQDAGLKTADNGLQFSLRDQTAGQQQQQTTGNRAPVTVDDELPAIRPIPAVLARYVSRAGGVDIRV